MNRLLCLCMTLILTPSLVIAGGIRLRYGFAPGQQWECTRITQNTNEFMGKTQVFKWQKDTILYTVAKGPKKNWVRLTAQYINSSQRLPRSLLENQPNQTLDGLSDTQEKLREKIRKKNLYDLIFSADMHTSGDTRNIQVQGVDKVNNDPSILPEQKKVIVEEKKSLAQSLPPHVFWFPELPEDPLEPGDEFETERTDNHKDPDMSWQSETRTVYTLIDVSKGLAYFETKERHSAKYLIHGYKTDYRSSSKGEIIFDLKKGMWIESKSKTSSRDTAGGMMIVQEKLTMQQK